MRVLIVGVGYVGMPLGATLVQAGHTVFGLRRSAAALPALSAAGIQPLSADITRPETLAPLPRNFDWVINCAATGGGSVEDYQQLYLAGTRHLLAWLTPAFRDQPAARYLYTSSTGVYAQNDGSLVDETSPTEPASPTARVLVETEQTLLAAAREQHFPALILRASGIYGPGRGYLLRQFLTGDARLDGDGSRILNMIHRDDLIAAIIAALARSRPGEIYNVTDDEPVSQLAFYTWLAAKLGRSLPPGAPDGGEVSRRRGLTSKRISNQKLRHELGVALTYPTFREGYTAELAAQGLI
jgi:nucleoside-diphosphate-sugar epimerase